MGKGVIDSIEHLLSHWYKQKQNLEGIDMDDENEYYFETIKYIKP